jgi:hypothetical protein
MRTVAILFFCATIGLGSCSGKDAANIEKSPAAPTDVQRLNDSANDPSLAREERAKAIFALFAKHIKVGCGPSDVHKVLIRTDWLKDAHADAVRMLGGWIPCDLGSGGDTVYCIWLFADKEGWSDWVIYFRLSGNRLTDKPEDDGNDAREFLKGNASLPGNPKLQEFALCPPPGAPIQRFTAKGMVECDNEDPVAPDDAPSSPTPPGGTVRRTPNRPAGDH